jgi:hypothetical protein
MENANEQVQQRSKTEYPLNPVVHRGQDPELFGLINMATMIEKTC